MTSVSVVTVCFNSEATIARTLDSVAVQTHPAVEHIVIDGASRDATLKVVAQHGQHVARLVSERDQGIYDAMNKGFSLATGEVVAFLNSDDHYADSHVLADVAAAFEHSGCDFAYGGIRMVDAQGRVLREWPAEPIGPQGLRGAQLAHPAFFARRALLARLAPPFDPSYRIAADLKQQLQVVNVLKAHGRMLAGRPLVTMAVGGESTAGLSSYLAGWRESARAYNEVMGSGGAAFTACKVYSKLAGWRRPG